MSFSISRRIDGFKGSTPPKTWNITCSALPSLWASVNRQRSRPRGELRVLKKGFLYWKRLLSLPSGQLSLIAILVFVTAIGHFQMLRRLDSARHLGGNHMIQSVQILFKDRSLRSPTRASMRYPSKLRRADVLMTTIPDFGGLVVRIPEDKSRRLGTRVIQHEFQHDLIYQNLISGPNEDDSVEGYYAFDDDNARNPILRYDNYDLHKDKRCRRTNWHRTLFNNCLTFHEYDTLTQFRNNELQYVS
jgi:hypothetical protein